MASIVDAPLAWWVMNNWLSNFAYRIKIGMEIFLVSIAATSIIALLTVGYHSLKAILANPGRQVKT